MGLSASKQLLPGSLGEVLLTGQSLVPSWVIWALTWCFAPSTHLPTVIKPSSPWNFNYEVSTWSLERWEESAQQQLPVCRGVRPSSTQGIKLEAAPFSWFFSDLHNGLFNRGVGLHWLGTLGGGFLWLCGQGFLQESHAAADGLVREGDVTFHLLPELHYIRCQKAWFALSRLIGFLCPKLEGLGIGNHLPQLQFPSIPAGKLRVILWKEALLAGAWWGRIVIFHPMLFTDLPQKFKGGQYLPC